MSSDVLDLAGNMDRQSLEWQLAVQCAPLITGLKVSNLLMLPAACLDSLAELISDSDLSMFLLRQTEHKAVLLLYREKDLEAFLMNGSIREILREEGYTGTDLASILAELKVRYTGCRNGKCIFPHEMGVFLGYPEEDVRGFMKWNGRNFLYAGYWKVYGEKEKKIRLFRAYDRACDTMIRLLNAGRSINEVINLYRNKRDRFAASAA